MNQTVTSLTVMDTLNLVDVVSLDSVSIISGYRKMRPEDLNLGVGGELPPEMAATLGSKKVINPEDLKRFRTLKMRAVRLLESVGVKFLGGYAIPRDKTDQIAQSLNKCREQFNLELAEFMKTYDENVEKWVQQFPTFERALRRAVWPAHEVSRRMAFAYAVYRIEGAAQSGQLEETVANLGGSLLDEVAAEADEIYENAILKREDKSISRRTLPSLRRLRNKLHGLSFLDPAIPPMVMSIDDVIHRCGEEGPIEGAMYHEVVALVLILSDPDKIKKHGAGLIPLTSLFEGDVGLLSDPEQGNDGEADGWSTATGQNAPSTPDLFGGTSVPTDLSASKPVAPVADQASEATVQCLPPGVSPAQPTAVVDPANESADKDASVDAKPSGFGAVATDQPAAAAISEAAAPIQVASEADRSSVNSAVNTGSVAAETSPITPAALDAGKAHTASGPAPTTVSVVATVNETATVSNVRRDGVVQTVSAVGSQPSDTGGDITASANAVNGTGADEDEDYFF